MKHHENLANIFELNLEPKEERLPAVVNDGESEEQKDDFSLARETMRDVLEKSADALDEMIVIAKNTEHPRSFEVAAQLAKTVSEISKDLLELHKQRKDLNKTEGSVTPIGTQNNIMFTGTSDDLFRMLKQKKNGNDSNTIEQ